VVVARLRPGQGRHDQHRVSARGQHVMTQRGLSRNALN
jgi:hypothetical protein